MPNCTPRTLRIERPTLEAQRRAGCGPACGGLGSLDCQQRGITPRRKREAVIEQIKDYVLAALGAPVVKIELDEQQLDIAISKTLKIMEYYAPTEFFSYYTFITDPGKSVYEMPPEVGFIRQVNYRAVPEWAFIAGDLQGAIPIEYFYPGGAYSSIQGGLIDPIQPIWGRAGEWTLYKQYERMYTRMSSSLGGWEWLGDYHSIKLYPIPFRAYHVSVHYIQKCKDWEEMIEPMWEGATAYAKQMLGMIRRKYLNPPGPNGGVQMDGQQLYQEGKEEEEKWKEDLIYKFGDGQLPIVLG
jgi:hypothetical protein